MRRDSFHPAQAQEVAAAFGKHGVDYMFIGKSGAILLGYPGTTQDVDVFPRKDAENGRRIVSALTELGFAIDGALEAVIIRGKDVVQIKNGPFDIDLVSLQTASKAMTKQRHASICPADFQSLTFAT